MKNVTKTYYNAYELKEINESGYWKAYDNYVTQNDGDYPYWNESKVAIERFLDLFNCKLIHLTMNSCYIDDFKFISNDYTWLYNEETEEEDLLDIDEIEGKQIKEYLTINNLLEIIEKYDECPLTGYYLDIDLLSPIVEYVKDENYNRNITLYDLIHEGLSKALNIIDGDFEYMLSEEAFIDFCECNDLYFDIDGNLE